MKDKISFIYNPHIHFNAFKFVIQSVRKNYPDSDVFVYMDIIRNDLKQYEEFSLQNNCTFIKRDQEMFFINKNDSMEINFSKMKEWFNRLKLSCEKSNAEWMLLLEDDVIVKKQIEKWPNSDVGTCRSYFRPGGGSIFKRKIFLEAIENSNILEIMTKVENAHYAQDVVLEHIFRMNGAKFEEWVELAEPSYRENVNHSIFHGYKDLYNK